MYVYDASTAVQHCIALLQQFTFFYRALEDRFCKRVDGGKVRDLAQRRVVLKSLLIQMDNILLAKEALGMSWGVMLCCV